MWGRSAENIFSEGCKIDGIERWVCVTAPTEGFTRHESKQWIMQIEIIPAEYVGGVESRYYRRRAPQAWKTKREARKKRKKKATGVKRYN